jgi:hypothetical protein
MDPVSTFSSCLYFQNKTYDYIVFRTYLQIWSEILHNVPHEQNMIWIRWFYFYLVSCVIQIIIVLVGWTSIGGIDLLAGVDSYRAQRRQRHANLTDEQTSVGWAESVTCQVPACDSSVSQRWNMMWCSNWILLSCTEGGFLVGFMSAGSQLEVRWFKLYKRSGV